MSLFIGVGHSRKDLFVMRGNMGQLETKECELETLVYSQLLWTIIITCAWGPGFFRLCNLTGRYLDLYNVEQVDIYRLSGLIHVRCHIRRELPRKMHASICSTFYKFKCL